MIMEPGIFDISEEDYHNDPCDPLSVSCSVLQLIDTHSPLHAMWSHPKLNFSARHREANNLDFGTAFHMLMTGKGRSIIPVDAPDWRTKEAKMQRERIRNNGSTPILGHKLQLANRMVEEVKTQLGEHEGVTDLSTDGQSKFEKTIIWKEDDYYFRCRPDVLYSGSDIMFDYKATEASAAPESFQRHIYNMNYDFRAAFYARGYKASTGKDLQEYRFIACEVEPPHALSIFSLAPEAMAFASKRVDRAIGIWKECLKNNQWPGYPKKVIYVSPPKWAENQQIDREIAEQTHVNASYES